MKTNEELEIELEELKKEFYFFSKNGSQSVNKPSSGSQGGTTSSNDDEDGWTVLYDMYSDDPAINLGKTTGIHGNDGYIDGMPDLLQFSKIRLTFLVHSALQVYEFPIPKYSDYNGMRILQHDGIGSMIVAAATSVDVLNGKGLLYFGQIRQIGFAVNKYPSLTSLNSELYARYERIIAK